MDISDFYSLRHIAFFNRLHCARPHGMIELWNVGILGMIKAELMIPAFHIPTVSEMN